MESVMKRVIPVLALAALASPVAAQDPRWHAVGVDSSGVVAVREAASYRYLDDGRIQTEAAYWMTELSEVELETGVFWPRLATINVTVDCVEETVEPTRTTLLDDTFQIVATQDMIGEPIAPETELERRMLRAVCADPGQQGHILGSYSSVRQFGGRARLLLQP
jgi:hypothetical protein